MKKESIFSDAKVPYSEIVKGTFLFDIDSFSSVISALREKRVAILSINVFSYSNGSLEQQPDLCGVCDTPKGDWDTYCSGTQEFARELVDGFKKIEDRGFLKIALELLDQSETTS